MTSKLWKSTVFVHLADQTDAVPAGVLHINEASTNVLSSTFGFGKRYLERANAIPIDPASLGLSGAVPGTERLYQPINDLALFGAVRDCLPDAWGRRVIENKLKAGPNSLPESTYLAHSGATRVNLAFCQPEPK